MAMGGGACAPLAFSCSLEEEDEEKKERRKEVLDHERGKSNKQACCLKCAGVVCPTGTLTAAAPSGLAA